MAHLPAQCAAGMSLKNSRGANVLELSEMLAGSTGLEPAASGVTGRRSNQLNYDPVSRINEMPHAPLEYGFCKPRTQRTDRQYALPWQLSLPEPPMNRLQVGRSCDR